MRDVKCKNCTMLINGWCEKVMDSPDPTLVRDCQYFRQKTNSDKLRQMNDAELAKFLCGYSDCNPNRCPGHDLCTWGDGCANGLLKWLQQPVEEDN